MAVCNPWRHARAPALLHRYEQLYLLEMQHTPWLFQLSYTLSELPIVDRLLGCAIRQLSTAAIRQALAEHGADLVISLYPQFSATVAAIYGTTLERPKLMTVVTDLGAVHRLWFSRNDDCCAVPTTIVRQQALDCGLDPKRVLLTGLPVQTSFGAPSADRTMLRQALGGGAGVGELADLAQALDRAELPLQLVVVAGTNASLAERLRAYPWHIPVHVYDFVPLADLMHAADIVATKAGGLTLSEALAAGKPLLIYGAPVGQESGNRRYVQAIGAGCWTPTAEALVAQVRRFLADSAALSRLAAAARQHGHPEAAYRVVAVAWNLIAGTPAALPSRAQAEVAIAGLDGSR